jgi:hypothetical protein
MSIRYSKPFGILPSRNVLKNFSPGQPENPHSGRRFPFVQTISRNSQNWEYLAPGPLNMWQISAFLTAGFGMWIDDSAVLGQYREKAFVRRMSSYQHVCAVCGRLLAQSDEDCLGCRADASMSMQRKEDCFLTVDRRLFESAHGTWGVCRVMSVSARRISRMCRKSSRWTACSVTRATNSTCMQRASTLLRKRANEPRRVVWTVTALTRFAGFRIWNWHRRRPLPKSSVQSAMGMSAVAMRNRIMASRSQTASWELGLCRLSRRTQYSPPQLQESATHRPPGPNVRGVSP